MAIASPVWTRVQAALLTLAVPDKPLSLRLIEAHLELHGVRPEDFSGALRDRFRSLLARMTAADEPARGGFDATITIGSLSDLGRFEIAQELVAFSLAVARLVDPKW
jgi:hypothetical protein